MAAGGSTRRRQALAMAMGASSSLLAAGCAAGGAQGTQGGGAAGSGAAPTPGTRQGMKVAVANPAGGVLQGIYERELKRFEQLHPGLTAEYVSTQGQNHLEKVTAAFAAGTPYDVVRLSPNDTPGFVERGQLRAIDDLVRRDRYDLSDFAEKCLAQYYWKGKLYALPLCPTYPL